MYDESMLLVKKGLFSNFSDLVRSGIRGEFKEMMALINDLDEKLIYNDRDLIEGVKISRNEFMAGKGKAIKNEKELDKYFNSL